MLAALRLRRCKVPAGNWDLSVQLLSTTCVSHKSAKSTIWWFQKRYVPTREGSHLECHKLVLGPAVTRAWNDHHWQRK